LFLDSFAGYHHLGPFFFFWLLSRLAGQVAIILFHGISFDYALGLLVALHIFAVVRLIIYWRCNQVVQPVNYLARYLADRMSSLYAFHIPLLYLASVSLPCLQNDPLQVAAVLCLGVMIALVLHWATEKRRAALQHAAKWALQHLACLPLGTSSS
jgi:hypothetical protein